MKKTTQKRFWTFAFILLNVAVIAITAFNEFGNSKNADKLSNVDLKWWLLIPAAICFIVAIFLEIWKYVLVMQKTSKTPVKDAWKTARRTVLIGRYYDNITPAAIGGQPFQIYYMNKTAGLPAGLATTIPIIGMISGQIGFLIIAIFAFIFGGPAINNVTLVATACFGLIFYAFWPVAVMLATFFPKATAKIITFGVKILAKFHIVKDKQSAIKKAEDGVADYATSVKQILKTKWLFAKTILMSVGFHLLISSIPFFVLQAFGGDISFMSCFLTTLAVTAAVYFVPTPGNAGAAEGTFYLVFSGLSSGFVFWAMLIWRFFSYYIYVIMGAITYLIMKLEKRKNVQTR